MGKNLPEWVNKGYQEYAKRFPSALQLNLIEIPPIKRGNNTNTEQLITQEGQLLLAKIPAASFIIALDEHGTEWSTEELAKQLQKWRENWQSISLLIGGADGLATECLKKANITWSLSKLTLPHPLVRVVVAEQIYRAWSIINNHPYHRGDCIR